MNSILNDMFHTDTESIGWGFEKRRATLVHAACYGRH